MNKGEKVVDRFAEMNTVLESCTSQVQERANAFIARQKAIHKDATKAQGAVLTDQQIGTMIGEVVNARRTEINVAVAAAILGAIKSE